MISEIKPSELPLNLNTEINDLLDKTWSKNPQSSKEQQDKLRHEIYQYFLQRLSAKLNDSNPNEITDLIVDKSVHISEVLSSYEWPSAETLKVPNLHRCLRNRDLLPLCLLRQRFLQFLPLRSYNSWGHMTRRATSQRL